MGVRCTDHAKLVRVGTEFFFQCQALLQCLASILALQHVGLLEDREVEVANSVIDGPNSVVYDEAENRMHAQKAVMALTMR